MKWLGLVLLLSACGVHSKAPLFGQGEAVALLGAEPVSVTVVPIDAERPFRAFPGRLDLVPEGDGYRVVQPRAEGPTDLRFVPLGSGTYALAYGVRAGQDYVLARGSADRLEIAPLDCARLKTFLRLNPLLTFVDSGCRLNPGTDERAAFVGFAGTVPPSRAVMAPE